MRASDRAGRTVLMALALAVAATPGMSTPAAAEDVPFTLLQLNDVYEILPLKKGGPKLLARAAALQGELRAENRRTYSFLVGDFLSPSPMMLAEDPPGKRLAGRQMVGVLEAMKLDFVTFGNHEFDLTRDEFYERLNETKFSWVSSNVSKPDGSPLHGIPRFRVFRVEGDHGAVVRVGLIGLTIDKNKVDYVRYGDPIAAARAQVAALRGACDVLIALTHLERDQDQKLAAAIPEIDLILGGHEHEYSYDGPNALRHAPIAKADSNARTAFIHRLNYDTQTGVLRIGSELKSLGDDQVQEDKATSAAIDKWSKISFDGLGKKLKSDNPPLYEQLRTRPGLVTAEGVDFTAELVQLPERLEGREKYIGFGSTNLTKLLTGLMFAQLPDGPEPGLALLNTGSIRIDDVLGPGMIRLYDLYRVLPYNVAIFTVRMKGGSINQLLKIARSLEMQGQGTYFQTWNVESGKAPGTWTVDGEVIEDARTYRVAINDYLVLGKSSRFSSIIKKRKVAELASLSLKKNDELELIGPTKPEEPTDLLSILVKALTKPGDYQKVFEKIGPAPKDEDSGGQWPKGKTVRLEIQCGMTPSDDGYPERAATATRHHAAAAVDLPRAPAPPAPAVGPTSNP
jgi:5'-nucleotidase / UDP-sugar diphosphatase